MTKQGEEQHSIPVTIGIENPSDEEASDEDAARSDDDVQPHEITLKTQSHQQLGSQLSIRPLLPTLAFPPTQTVQTPATVNT